MLSHIYRGPSYKRMDLGVSDAVGHCILELCLQVLAFDSLASGLLLLLCSLKVIYFLKPRRFVQAFLIYLDYGVSRYLLGLRPNRTSGLVLINVTKLQGICTEPAVCCVLGVPGPTHNQYIRLFS